jgi:serine/threonine protein kinase
VTSFSSFFAFNTLQIDPKKLRLKSVIGRGNFGEVFLATWLGSPVAVKTMLPELQSKDKLVRRFVDEILLMARLTHPNVVLFLGASIRKPALFLVLEYCSNGSLHHFLKHEADHGVRITMSLIYRFALDTARGVYYLHKKANVWQRDLKARNLLVDESLNVKVADFGLSRVMAEAGEDAKLTACGTPAWTAPEIVKMERYTEKVDVYSMGIVLWELITRQEPYGGQKGVQIAYAAAEQGLRPKIPAYCPQDYADLMQECWAANPDERPPFEEILKRLFQLKKAADQAAALAVAAGGLAAGAPGFSTSRKESPAAGSPSPSPPSTSRRASAAAAQQIASPVPSSAAPRAASGKARPSPAPLDTNAANAVASAGTATAGGAVTVNITPPAPGASPHPVKHHISQNLITPKTANAGPIMVSTEDGDEPDTAVAVAVASPTGNPTNNAAAKDVNRTPEATGDGSSESAIDYSKQAKVKAPPAAAPAAAAAPLHVSSPAPKKPRMPQDHVSSQSVPDDFTPLPDAADDVDETGSGAATNGDSPAAVATVKSLAVASSRGLSSTGNGANGKSFGRREDVQRAIDLGIVNVAAAQGPLGKWDGDVTN